MIEIPVGKDGEVAYIDDEDFDLVSEYTWNIQKGRNGAKYACAIISIPMHRLIMDDPPGKIVDHIDRNGLNNQKDNLRLATNRQNLLNRGAPVHNKSGAKGVSRSHHGKWRARIGVNGREVFLGYYDTIKEAADAYDEAIVRIEGEWAYVNNYGTTTNESGV